mmetsp:Transcript_25883/g.62354  ORF Transcript_25883/g.62354 Transcript_25883/m.62354 type:complete len:210 (+) Transcript_25883:70-699(+)
MARKRKATCNCLDYYHPSHCMLSPSSRMLNRIVPLSSFFGKLLRIVEPNESFTSTSSMSTNKLVFERKMGCVVSDFRVTGRKSLNLDLLYWGSPQVFPLPALKSGVSTELNTRYTRCPQLCFLHTRKGMQCGNSRVVNVSIYFRVVLSVVLLPRLNCCFARFPQTKVPIRLTDLPITDKLPLFPVRIYSSICSIRRRTPSFRQTSHKHG